MSKKVIILIVLVVITAGVFCGYFILSKSPKNIDENNESIVKDIPEREFLIEFDKSTIDSLKIIKESSEILYKYLEVEIEETVTSVDGSVSKEKRTANRWCIVEPEKEDIISNKIDSILWQMSGLAVEEIIEEEAEDLSVYGLDEPQALIIATSKDESKYTLEIGNKVPVGNGHYVKLPDTNRVVLISSYIVNSMLISKLDLMNKEIHNMDPTKIEKFKLIRKDAVIIDTVMAEDLSWDSIEPLKWKANSGVLATIFEGIGGLSVLEYVEDDASDLSQYGLKSPQYIVEFADGEQSVTLHLGNEAVTKTEVYGCIAGKNDVFTVDANIFNFIDKSQEEFIEPFIGLYSIWDIDTLKVTMDGIIDDNVLHFNKASQNKDEEKDREYAIFNGFEISEDKYEDMYDLYKKYYQGIIGVTINKINTDVEPIKSNVEVKFEYTFRDNKEPVVLEFVPAYDNYSYYIFNNNEYTGLLVKQKDFDDKDYGLRTKRAELNELIEAEKE